MPMFLFFQEKLDSFFERSNELSEQSFKFKKSSVRLYKRSWSGELFMIGGVCIVSLMLLYLLLSNFGWTPLVWLSFAAGLFVLYQKNPAIVSTSFLSHL